MGRHADESWNPRGREASHGDAGVSDRSTCRKVFFPGGAPRSLTLAAIKVVARFRVVPSEGYSRKS